jgi:hypothetical protein
MIFEVGDLLRSKNNGDTIYRVNIVMDGGWMQVTAINKPSPRWSGTWRMDDPIWELINNGLDRVLNSLTE